MDKRARDVAWETGVARSPGSTGEKSLCAGLVGQSVSYSSKKYDACIRARAVPFLKEAIP